MDRMVVGVFARFEDLSQRKMVRFHFSDLLVKMGDGVTYLPISPFLQVSFYEQLLLLPFVSSLLPH
jgi:hypothetical protein